MVNNIFILDKHLKTTKVLTPHSENVFFDDTYTLDLSTGTETYEFSTPISEIDESNYIMFYYHGKYKLFQIIELTQEHYDGKIISTIYAETACLELLNDVVRSFEGEYNAISFLEHVLEGSSWSIGKYSSSLAEKVVSVKVDKTTQKWSCIQDYMDDFGYEISPYVVYDNGHVKSKVIDVYSEGELGELTYKRFEYGRNVSGMVKEKDLYEWCTALIIDTDKDVTNVTYDKDGYIKKAGSDVVLATNENSKYNLGRDYIYSNFEAKDCNDATDAVVKAIEELKRRATPRFDYECTTALTYEEYDNLNLGDTVYCIDHTFSPPLTLEARVGKLKLSFTDRSKCKCTLTNYKEVKSKMNTGSTAAVRDIVDSYFPVTGEGIADGSVNASKIEGQELVSITLRNSTSTFKVDGEGNITGANITGSAFQSKNNIFQVRNDGTVSSNDITVSGEVSANSVTCDNLSVAWHDRCLTEDVVVYITPGYSYTTNLDKNYFNNEVTFASFAEMISVAPRNLNGYTLDIYMTANMTEKVTAINFHSGRLRIHMQGHVLNGYMRFSGFGLKVLVYGNTSSSTKGTTRGAIVPGAVGYLYGDIRYGLYSEGIDLTVYDIDFYAGTATDYDTCGIACSNNCNGYLSSIRAVNTLATLLRANARSYVYVDCSSGRCSSYSFVSASGSTLILNDTTQCGRSTSGYCYTTTGNAQIYYTGALWDTSSITGSNTNTDTSTTGTGTTVITSDTGYSWRVNAASWTPDRVVKQGFYSYSEGFNKGYWFFGNKIYDILQNNNNTINSMKVTITRNSGGQTGSVTHYLRAHTIGDKPSGEPTDLLSTSVLNIPFSLVTNSSVTISLRSTQIAELKSEGVKGFGLYTDSVTADSYSCCSSLMTVTIAYKTSQ